MSHFFAVIMAGGSGTRLWPVSRQSHPKHTLPLLGTETLFQSTVERLAGLFPLENILVVTAMDQVLELKRQEPLIPVENFLVEPAPRGTASVVGLAATVLRRRDPQAVMAVLPSDHFIRNRDLFHHVLRVAYKAASQDYLVTLGITPTYPATGYGYIQRGDLLPDDFGYPVYQVQRFKEKPGEAQARDLVTHGDHYWNSGMFIWRAETILAEIGSLMPALRDGLLTIDDTWGTPQWEATLQAVWSGLQPVTIDYGIMERTARVVVLPAGGLEWSDVGSWDSLFDVLIQDANGNIVFGSEHIPVDTQNSLVYTNGEKKMVVTIGLDDLIIVNTKDVLMICHKDQTQKVRQVVEHLRKKKRENYL